MSLNIKDEHIHDLVRRAAARTGLSQTRAASGLDQLLDRVHAELTASGGALDFDALYDPETGLPR